VADLITPETPDEAVSMGWQPVTPEEEKKLREQFEDKSDYYAHRERDDSNKVKKEMYVNGVLCICFWEPGRRGWDWNCFRKP
jgi:hypothetical protein